MGEQVTTDQRLSEDAKYAKVTKRISELLPSTDPRDLAELDHLVDAVELYEGLKWPF